MELPEAQEGALNKATRGFAVGTATGILPLTNGVTWKLTVFEVVSPDVKSLMTTWMRYTPSTPVGFHRKCWEVQVPALSVPTLKSRAKERGLPRGATLNWKVRGPELLSVAFAVQVIDVPISWGDVRDGVRDTIWTVAYAGAHSTASNPVTYRQPFLRLFIGTSPRYQPISVVFLKPTRIKMNDTTPEDFCQEFPVSF